MPTQSQLHHDSKRVISKLNEKAPADRDVPDESLYLPNYSNELDFRQDASFFRSLDQTPEGIDQSRAFIRDLDVDEPSEPTLDSLVSGKGLPEQHIRNRGHDIRASLLSENPPYTGNEPKSSLHTYTNGHGTSHANLLESR